jgi:hypothetical protein
LKERSLLMSQKKSIIFFAWLRSKRRRLK